MTRFHLKVSIVIENVCLKLNTYDKGDLSSVAKIIQNTLKAFCIRFSQNVKMQDGNGTDNNLSPLNLDLVFRSPSFRCERHQLLK